jgi:hypothetical protein
MGDIFFQIFLALLGIVISIYAQTIRREGQRRLLRVFGALLFLFAGLWAGFSLGAIQATPTQPPPTETPTVKPTDSPSPKPSDTPTSSVQQSEFVGYDFESGTQGWSATETDYKKVELSSTNELVYAGSSALVVNSELFGSGSAEFASHNNDDVYRHTEALVYMNNSMPQGFDQPGPYDLSGKTFSCRVYLPASLAVEDSSHAYVRLIAKDIKFANQMSDPEDITANNVEQWIELSFVIGDGSNSDAGFDPTRTNALGVRIDSLDGSTVQYSGAFYIDHCSIK